MKLFLATIFILTCSSCTAILQRGASGPCERSLEALRAASEVRGLPMSDGIGCRSLNQDEFQQLAYQTVLRDISVQQLPLEERVLFYLGFIPADYRYSECFADALSAEAAAFYNSHANYFALPDWRPTPMAVLVHESVHALEDERYETSRFGKSKFLFTDNNLAAAALLEGSAQYFEQRFLESDSRYNDEADLDPSDKLSAEGEGCALPYFLQEVFYGIYSYGYYFVSTVVDRAGAERFEECFDQPPRTSSEILHPKRFLAGVRYPPLEAPKPELESFSQSTPVLSESFGEMFLRIFFKSYFNPKKSTLAAHGWLGDRFALYSDGQRDELVWRTVWTRERDTRQFLQALLEVSKRRFQVPLIADGNVYRLDLSSSVPESAVQRPGVDVTDFRITATAQTVTVRVRATLASGK